MLNIAKRVKSYLPRMVNEDKVESVNEIQEIVQPIVSVAEIQNDFNTSSEVVLDELKATIKTNKLPSINRLGRADKLRERGFYNIEEVQETGIMKNKIQAAQKEIDIVMHYINQYPKHKFILNTELARICKKYELLLGDSEQFIANIPEKNIDDIVNFEVDEDDLRLFKVNTNVLTFFSDDSPQQPEEKSSPAKLKTFKVVAPKNNFNIDFSTHQIQNGYELKKLPQDPIVLCPVNNGYLIVTMWGEEAEIGEVQ